MSTGHAQTGFFDQDIHDRQLVCLVDMAGIAPHGEPPHAFLVHHAPGDSSHLLGVNGL